MDNPEDYEYRYALHSQVPCYKFTGWEVAGYAGHFFQFEPVWFVQKRVKTTKRKAETAKSATPTS